MRRVKFLGGALLSALILMVVPGAAGASQFSQCPPVRHDAGCQFLLNVTNAGTVVEQDETQGPFDGSDDTLVGVVNNSSNTITSLPLTAEDELFGFENDGICEYVEGEAIPSGCVVLAQNGSKEPNAKAGKKCSEAPEEELYCGFPPPEAEKGVGGEPSGLTFPEGVSPVGYGKNGDPVSGYEGPRTWFTGIKTAGEIPDAAGIVNFSPALKPGESTFFSLESPPAGGFGTATKLTTNLSGAGQSGASITVLQGTPVTDSATLSGANASTAAGAVTYNVYSDSACTTLAAAEGSAALAGGSAGASSAETTLAPGRYYWRARYGGDVNNQAVSSECGSEILTVLAPTATTTTQTAGGLSGANLTAILGTPVTDQAHITGSLAASATGTVVYRLYSDSKCTKEAAPSSSVLVTGGVVGSSAAVSPKLGRYYWKAEYSGAEFNAPSTSACGSEILQVAHKAEVGLPHSNACVSRRRFVIHPRAPHGVKLVSVEVQINGQTVKKATLHHGATTVSLVGLPKGAFKIGLIATASNGQVYEDLRTFHTCVPKKSKR